MSSNPHNQPFYTHHQSQNMNSLSISSSYNQLPTMNDNGNQNRDNLTAQLGHRAGLPSTNSFTSSIKSSQSTTSLHSIAPRTISTNEMVNFNDKFIKKSRNSKVFTTIKKSPSFNSRNSYNPGQYNYPNHYQYQNSNQYPNQHPNQYPNQYSNQYPNQYPRQKQQQPSYKNQYLTQNQHQYQPPNQPPNQYPNQYPNQHPSQHTNQRQSYPKHRHRSSIPDNYNSKSSDQMVDRRFIPNQNQPPNPRHMNPYPIQSKPKNINSKNINAYQHNPRNNDQFYQNQNQNQTKSQNFQDQRPKQNYQKKNVLSNQPTRYHSNKPISLQNPLESQSVEIPSIRFYQQPMESTNLENNLKEIHSNEKDIEVFDTSIDSMDQNETLQLSLPEEDKIEVERKVSNSGSFEFPNGEVFNVKNPNSNNKIVKPLSKNYQPESYVHSNNSNNTNNNVNHLNHLNQQTPSTEGSAKFSIHSKSTPSTVTSSSSTSLSKMHGTNDPSMFSPVTQITVNENDMENNSEKSYEDAVDVKNINNISKSLPVLTRKLSQPVAKPTPIKKTETKKEVKKSKFGFFKKIFKINSNSDSSSNSNSNSMNRSSTSLSSNNLKKSNSGFSFKKLSIIKRSSTNNSNLSLVSENKKIASNSVNKNTGKTQFNENRDNTPTLEDEVKTLEGNNTFDTIHSEDIFHPLELKNIITNSTVGTDTFSFLAGDEQSKENEEKEPEHQEVFKNSEYKLSLPELEKSKPEEFDFDYLSTVFGLGETSFFSTKNDKEIKNGEIEDGAEELKRKKSVFKSIENKLSVRRLRSKSISNKSLKKLEKNQENNEENGEEDEHLNEIEVEIHNEENVLQNDRVSKVIKFTEIQQPNKFLNPLKGCLKNPHKNIIGYANEHQSESELEKDVKFSNNVLWSDSFSSKDYDRFNPEMKHVYCMLTYYPRQVRDIRIELNLYKEYEMEVNQFSRQYTHFFRT